MIIFDRICLALTIIGGINWGSIGLFGFDLVGAIFVGQDSIGARIIFVLVGLASLWCLSILFRSWNPEDLHGNRN